MSRPELSIVIPAFNEEVRIVGTLETLVEYLYATSLSWEVLVVDDGSSDETAAVVAGWAADREGVRLESIQHRGKGAAVRHGMLASAGRYRFLCDADLAMPVEGLTEFLKRMGEGYDIVIGSRQIAGARRFNEPATRHIAGRMFNWAVRLLAVGDFQDTQCGFKCFRGEVADQLFALQRTEGFGFDVEILYLALKRRLRVLEMPIDWHHQRDSKVRAVVDPVLMLRDILLVRWSDLRGRYRLTAGSTPWSAADSPRRKGAVDVVVPTYNEAENLPELAERLFALDLADARLIVVDDSSPDGTAQVARGLADRFAGRVELIERKGKQGLGTAYMDGFARALEDGADYVIQMDADLSHAPEQVPALLKALQEADVVVGSRYVPGGAVDTSWDLSRRLLSYLANFGIRAVVGLKVKDVTSGFKAFRAGALTRLDPTEFRCRGFGFQAEVAHACQRLGLNVVEHPIVFIDRAEGKSKMSLGIALEAFWRLLPLRLKR
ncbi:MAG: glycosyltransferase [Chloroflexi bacterium]|nr:glycosyltransferase [Chloroflexota bacterium]